MKVVATKQGFYCNTIMEEGYVFELLKGSDGKDPQRFDWKPVLDDKGKDTGKGANVLFKDEQGRTRHRDFAPDEGEVMITEGPNRGEMAQVGWMEEVPEDTEVTLDVAEFRYGFDVETRKLNRTAPKGPARPARVKQVRRAG